MPLVRPVTVIGDAGPELFPNVPPSLDVQFAAYDVIALPLSAGAVNVTTICWFPRVTDGCAGASGTVAGTTVSDAAEAGLVPTALVAVTVQVYVLPFVRLVTSIGEPLPLSLPDVPPLLDVHDAAKDVIALPLSAPGVKATETEASPRVTPVMVGGSGTAAGMTGSDGREAVLVPTALVAVTVQV
ncbi:MAG TPA: hypothetical protein VL769_03550 [Acidimicrobiia bacterium]|nr:hypothetical protein [Acidimicrobiia bacterium]